MFQVLWALAADIAVTAALTVWGARILTGAEDALPLIDDAAEVTGLPPVMFGWLLVCGGALTAAVSIWRLIPLLRQLWVSKKLAMDGVCVSGIVIDMKKNRVLQVNKTYAVQLMIRCTPPSGLETEVKSPIMWAPEVQPGDEVDVVFDPMNEDRYFIRLREKKFVRDSLKEKGKKRFL